MATLKASSDLQSLIKKIVLDTYFPVGSIYLSVNKTNPGSTFGGTWELVTNDSYLHCYNPNNQWFANIGVNNNGTGNQQGSFNTNDTVLTVEQLPPHTHNAKHLASLQGNSNGWVGSIGTLSGEVTGSMGSGKGHSHFHVLPFYIVAVWKRIK